MKSIIRQWGEKKVKQQVYCLFLHRLSEPPSMRSPLLQLGGFHTFQSISGLVARSKLGILAARHAPIAAQHGGWGGGWGKEGEPCRRS